MTVLSPEPLLNVAGLHKRYGERVAVVDVSLQVKPGQVLGLLGPNGAGKSTTLSMISGLVPMDAGEVTVAGRSLVQQTAQAKQRLGLMTQDLALVDELSAQANAQLFGALYGLSGAALHARVAQVLAQVGLSDRAASKPSTFSGGMKRRLHLACALVHNPDVLLLDEPTAGVDPQSRHAIFETLLALKQQGKSLVYTTHYMEEIERLADQVVILDHGRVVAQGTVPQLLRRLPAAHKLTLQLEAALNTQAQHELQSLPGVRELRAQGEHLELALEDLAAGTAQVLAWLSSKGLAVRHLGSGRASLEDVFLNLTGRQLRDSVSG